MPLPTRTAGQHSPNEQDHNEKSERLRNEPAPVGERHHLGQRRLARRIGPLNRAVTGRERRVPFVQSGSGWDRLLAVMTIAMRAQRVSASCQTRAMTSA